MTGWQIFLTAAIVAAGANFGAQAAQDSAAEDVAAEDNTVEAEQAPPAQTAAAPKCLRASVNPVTGHTFCLEPRGAPVEPPEEILNKPCRKRAHDDDPFTVYERYSACD